MFESRCHSMLVVCRMLHAFEVLPNVIVFNFALKTKQLLSKLGIICDVRCLLCHSNIESHEHLIQLTYSLESWKLVMEEFNFQSQSFDLIVDSGIPIQLRKSPPKKLASELTHLASLE